MLTSPIFIIVLGDILFSNSIENSDISTLLFPSTPIVAFDVVEKYVQR